MLSHKSNIIRKPDAETAFLFNNVEVRYVGTHHLTGISFYCSLRTNYGVRVYPDGRKQLAKAYVRAIKKYTHGNAKYLCYPDAFGHNKNIYASHAVWMASGRTIPDGMTIDHINGETIDNRLENLRCLTPAQNQRDGGFLTKLRNKGFNPATISRTYLLRYYARMAFIKRVLTRHYYIRLSRNDLWQIVYLDAATLQKYLFNEFNIKIDFQLCLTTSKNCAD